MDKLPRIGLAYRMGRRYGEEAVRGIADYARKYGPWLFLPSPIAAFDISKSPDFDGIIVCYEPPPDAATFTWPKNIPVVSVHQVLSSIAPWQVQPDNHAVGRLVGEEFAGRKFRNFAYCPVSRLGTPTALRADQERFDGFLSVARKINSDVPICLEIPPTMEGYEEQWEIGPMSDWLRSLPKPVGIMGANDVCGRVALLGAEAAGINVPEEVAVIGVGNEAWAEVTMRGLSSVELDGYRAGYAAAELLSRLMGHQAVKSQVTYIPPRRLIIRRSSSTVAIDDPDVMQAMHVIFDRAASGIGVDDVVEAVPLSRRALERHFQRALGHSILQEICSVKIERAKLLLADETVPLRRVAAVSGFLSAQSLTTIFHRVAGITPSAYRAAMRKRQEPT